MWLSYIPVVFILFLHALLSKRIFFFTNVNPGIFSSGLFGASKFKILNIIPQEYVPKAILITPEMRFKEVSRKMKSCGISFPCICKPDIGERGFLVYKLESQNDLKEVINEAKINLILQEYVDFPLEVSIFCYRIPDSTEADLLSICYKEFLHVVGDGKSTLAQLIDQNPRAILHKPKLKLDYIKEWNLIPDANEKRVLVNIGNHCRGTKFLNGWSKYSFALRNQFLSILDQMPGFYYGRFDIRTKSWKDLERGENFRILEFNGAASEPAHVYDPKYPIWKAYRDFWRLSWIMRRIHLRLLKKGEEPMHTFEFFTSLRKFLKYKQAGAS